LYGQGAGSFWVFVMAQAVVTAADPQRRAEAAEEHVKVGAHVLKPGVPFEDEDIEGARE
jgi:CO/xanthine dehydrogenase Mo-binding subunit